MKLVALAMSALISLPVAAKIDSVNQIFFGASIPNNSCGAEGRLLSTKDISNIGHRKLCQDVKSQWAIWKILNSEENKMWSFMGYGYDCEIKRDVNPNAQSLCVMNDEPSPNTAFFFATPNYKGAKPWDGLAQIGYLGDENNKSSVRSFKLGQGIQLFGYSEPNYLGKETIYTESTSSLSYEMQSYKIKAAQLDKLISFSFSADIDYKVCLQLRAASSVQGLVTFCNTETSEPKPFAQIVEQAGTETVAIYVYEYPQPETPVVHNGALYLDFDGQGNFEVGFTQLPAGLNYSQQGDTLNFTYQNN